MSGTIKKYNSASEFYPFYLSQHANRSCRRLHFVGTTLAIGSVTASVVNQSPAYLLLAVVSGYFFAWIGHFFFEKNKPATFKYPLYSLICDFKMYGDMLSGKIKF